MKCRNPDSLGFSKNGIGFERFRRGELFCSLVILLNERFWGCLKTHATIPWLK